MVSTSGLRTDAAAGVTSAGARLDPKVQVADALSWSLASLVPCRGSAALARTTGSVGSTSSTWNS